MVQVFRLFSILIFLSTFSLLTFSQTENDNVKVQLSLVGEKTVYRIGEPLKLALTFTTNDENLMVNRGIPKKNDEILVLSNEDKSEWKTPFKSFSRNHTFVFNNSKISNAPTNIDFVLNTAVRFPKPGKYSLKIITNRVFLIEANQNINNLFFGGKLFL